MSAEEEAIEIDGYKFDNDAFGLEKAKAIMRAKQLQYSKEIRNRIANASTSYEIDRALRAGRMAM